MSIERVVIATTHIDKHNEMLLPEALESMAKQMDEALIPVRVEHDPRNPPIGRILSAQVRPTADGHMALTCDVEYFDEQSGPLSRNDHRKTYLAVHSAECLEIGWDRTYRHPEDQDDLRRLASFGTPTASLQERGKKALDPISILEIAGAFVLGQIATGFLTKVGSDSWDSFKQLVTRILTRKERELGEAILQLSFTVTQGTRTFNVVVLATSPQPVDVQALFELCLPQIDSLVKQCVASNDQISVVTLEYQHGSLAVKFAIREDGRPLFPTQGPGKNAPQR